MPASVSTAGDAFVAMAFVQPPMRDSTEDVHSSLPYRIRQKIGPWINRLAKSVGQPEYHVRDTEYAGTVECHMKELETKLREDGFSWTPFSFYHWSPMRTRPNGSWTYRSAALADRQLHVILFARPTGTIDIYAHTEYNWLRHPLKHMQQVGIDREEGAAQMRRWLETRGLEYNRESRLSWSVIHLLERIREEFSGRDTLESRFYQR